MRTTSIIDATGKPKSVAAYFLKVETSSTYSREPMSSIYHSKTLVTKVAKDLVESCKQAGTKVVDIKVFSLYRDRATGQMLPGRGVPHIRFGYVMG